MPEEQTARDAPAELSAFVPFDLQSFLPNRAPMVDLYHLSGQQYLLMCSAQAVLSKAAKQRLLQSGVRVLYARITSTGFAAGGRALPELIALPDDHLPVSVKAGLLFHSAISSTQTVLSGTTLAHTDIAAMCEFVGKIALQLSRNPATLQALMALMRHDSFVYVHSVNVAIYSTILAIQMGVGQEDVGHLSRAAFLHDVGKTRIPLDVLNKRGDLTKAEWALIRQHPQWSIEMLSDQLPKLPLAREIILQHHERMDGKGYPHGLSGDEIHPLSRVVALTDTFDALTAGRPYRAATNPVEALRVVKKDVLAGHLDRDAFMSFARMLGTTNLRELEKD